MIEPIYFMAFFRKHEKPFSNRNKRKIDTKEGFFFEIVQIAQFSYVMLKINGFLERFKEVLKKIF